MKKINDNGSFDTGEQKEYGGIKSGLSRYDYDLYDESKNKIEKVVRVKRLQLPNKMEKWRITENNKIMFVVDGEKISKKEKEFLRTPDGFNFLIVQYKKGIASLSALKSELKIVLKVH